MNISLVRIFTTYGPRGRYDTIPRILDESIVNDKPIREFSKSDTANTWIYISDIVSAFFVALKNPQGDCVKFNTGAPKSTALNDLIQCVKEVVGKRALSEHCLVPPGDTSTVGY